MLPLKRPEDWPPFACSVDCFVLYVTPTISDIVIPGTNTATNSGPSKIPAGENVLVIKTSKGVYIRTNTGRIFAVRSKGQPEGGTGDAGNVIAVRVTLTLKMWHRSFVYVTLDLSCFDLAYLLK